MSSLTGLGVSFDSSAKRRAPDGEPYARFAKLENGESGYYAYGERSCWVPPDHAVTFWNRVFHSIAAEENRAWDAVHTFGSGICAGALGLSGDKASAMLTSAFHCFPEHFCAAMGPALARSGVYVQEHTWRDVNRKVVSLSAVLSGEWKARRKSEARIWTSCTSKLLRDERLDSVQLASLQVQAELMPEISEYINWRISAADAWSFSSEQRVLWGIGIAMYLQDVHFATNVLKCCKKTQAIDTLKALKNSEYINERLQNILKHLARYERITL